MYDVYNYILVLESNNVTMSKGVVDIQRNLKTIFAICLENEKA